MSEVVKWHFRGQSVDSAESSLVKLIGEIFQYSESIGTGGKDTTVDLAMITTKRMTWFAREKSVKTFSGDPDLVLKASSSLQLWFVLTTTIFAHGYRIERVEYHISVFTKPNVKSGHLETSNTGCSIRTWASQYRQNKTPFLNDVYLSFLSILPIGSNILP
jgi:hypothetical protein